MGLFREETVVIHELAKEMKVRAGYPASVSVYERDGEFHYVALMGLTDEPNGSKRAAGMVHSHQIGNGYPTIWAAMAAGWEHIDGRWLGRTTQEVAEGQGSAQMVRGLLQTLGYVADQFESPVQWQCRSCEAEVSSDGVVAHTQFCVVGVAERLLGDDPHYGPPAGDAGMEEFSAG